MASDNPHWDILEGVAAKLVADPAITNLPTPSIREIPYVLGPDAGTQLLLVCPGPEGETLLAETFEGGERWGYGVLVLLITPTNRNLQAGLEARLAMRRAIRQRLFVERLLGDVATVIDVEARPRAVLDIQAALGAQVVVSGLAMIYESCEVREGISRGSLPFIA